MSTFADLLTEYMARVGIGDAEMARRVGVSRLTLIRWKEGVTSRPRYREDVINCADLLRLTPAERDGLLLAAGFSPDAPPAIDQTTTLAVPPPAEQSEVTAKSYPRPRKRRKSLMIAATMISVPFVAAIAVAAALILDDPSVAGPGESLMVVAPFVNYTGGQQGFNVRGRIKAEIDRQIVEAGLDGVRTMEWPEEIASEEAALDVARRSGATIVIWGEYDSGRIKATLTVPEEPREAIGQSVVNIASSPVELPAIINLDLADEVRSIALLTLGQLFLERQDFDTAKLVFIQALDQPPVDPAALASLWYRLGRAYQGGDLADLDEAISLFSKALAVYPQSVDVYSSRGLSYLERGRDGDASRAIADLTQAVAISPDAVSAHINRAVAFMERGQPGDLRQALTDLSRAIGLEPESVGALVNRGLVHSAIGDMDMSIADLRRAQELDPSDFNVNNTLCWQLGVQRRPQEALPFCELALQDDPDGQARDSRGLVYALMGRHADAAAEFRAFLDWTSATAGGECEAYYSPSRLTWIEQLDAGEDPFDAETLEDLRVKPGKVGSEPC